MGSIAVLGFAGGSMAYGFSVTASAVWALAMSVQSVTLAALLRWRKVTMDRAWDPLWTFAIAAVVVAVVAFLTVTTPPMREFGVSQDAWADWWGTGVLAIVLVIPPFLLVGQTAWPWGELAFNATAWSAIAILGAVSVRRLGRPISGRVGLDHGRRPCWFCSQFATARCSPSFFSWCWFASRRASPRRTSVHCRPLHSRLRATPFAQCRQSSFCWQCACKRFRCGSFTPWAMSGAWRDSKPCSMR